MINDWFIWNGRKCTEFGIHVSEQPPITLPAERATFTDVPGRNGSLTTLEGDDVYDDMVLSASCFIADPSRIPEIAAWLRGGGTVTFANRQGGFYYARIINQIPFDLILRGNPHRSFVVNFRCKPFFYFYPAEPVTLTASGSSITNPYCIASEPVITVYGTGTISLMVGMYIMEMEGIVDNIVLDSQLQEAYQGDRSANEHVGGEFPQLKPGLNTVSWDGTVTKLTIQPNWRTL